VEKDDDIARRDKRSVQMDRLSNAMTLLYYTHPLYYALSSQLGKIDASDEIDTMAVGFMKDDPACYLFFNVDFLASCSDEKLRFAVMHELLHVGLHHPTRGDGMDRFVANLAMDLIVNESHISEYNKLKPEEQDLIVLHQNRFKWVKDEATGQLSLVPNPEAGQPMFPCLEGIQIRESTMDEIYLKLMAAKDQVSKFKKKAPDFRPTKHDKFTPPRQGEKKTSKTLDSGSLTEEQKATLEKVTREAFRRLDGRDPGNVPGELRRRLEEFRKPAQAFPWRRELTIFAQTVLKDDRQRSWRRYNRRYGAASPGHVKEYRARLLVIVDNSGSTHDSYQMFMGHVITLSELVDELAVVGVDVRINFEATVKGGKIPDIKFGKSGGGTDMQPGFDYAKKGGYDGVICLTDGWLSIPQTHRIPTIFAICKNGQEVPGFKNVHLED